MAQDDLERPLTARGPRKAGGAPRFDGVAILACAVGAVLAATGLWALLVHDPLGGEPVVTAAIERRAPPRPAGASEAAPKPVQQAERPEIAHDGIPVVRPGDAMPKSGPVIISIPGADDAPSGVGAAAKPGEVQTAMLEDSRYGPLPRIAGDGRRPLDAYARPRPAAAAGARVALIVAGLGVGREATLAAVKALPGEVSFAFSPYGDGVGELVQKSRADGHEILIQTPMEPYSYPTNDPGPQTMLTSLPASANLERLRWALGRAQGYVGVAPLGGGRFLETDAALAPVFTELARRGLMFVGQSGGQSRFAAVADRAGLPHARPAAQIDATPDAAAIDAALGDLERDAKAGGGVAVGWASASPLTLKRIEAWRAGLASRGVALVPVSAAGGPQGPS